MSFYLRFMLMLLVSFQFTINSYAITIKICDDGGEWPPYTYYERSDNKKTDKIVGYSIDVIKEIFKAAYIEYKIALPPWKRCLHELQYGGYDLALSSAYSDARNEKYLLSLPYYQLTPTYFYQKSKFPNGLTITRADDLAKHQICGIQGYNYSNFKLDTSIIDTGAKNMQNLFRKLQKGYCDIILGRLEIVLGFSLVDQAYVNRDIAYASIPDAEKSNFYMLISRNSPYSKLLYETLNSGIRKLKESQQDKEILDKYFDQAQ